MNNLRSGLSGPFGAGVCLLALSCSPARAQNSEQLAQITAFSEAAARVLAPQAIVRALVDACDARQPALKAEHGAALEQWRRANEIEAFETALNGLTKMKGPIDAIRIKVDAAAKGHVGTFFAKDPAICGKLAQSIGTQSLSVREHAARAQSLAGQINAMFSPSSGGGAQAAAAPPRPTRLYTMAQLSVMTLTAMDRAGTQQQAASNSKVGDARNNKGSDAMKALGLVAMGGHIRSHGNFREHRFDQQSVFSARCAHFASSDEEKRFNALQGQDAVISGSIRSAIEHRSGGGQLALTNCRILDNTDQLPRADLPETGGLELRPPDRQEAFGGPNKGIAAEQIAEIVYKADFRNMIGAFGNGYTHRDEDTYVLLKDGTAYQHHWPFPPADLNIEMIKARDLAYWFRWEKSGAKLILTHSAGKDVGKRKEVSGYDAIEPFRAGEKLQRYYYYLNVGMGGGRFDQGYDFREDGTIELSHSSFIAGSTGYGGGHVGVSGPGFSYTGGGAFSQGFIMATGRSGKATAHYRFDGYALELINDKNEVERHFIGRFGADRGRNPPKSLFYEGEQLWSKDEKK